MWLEELRHKACAPQSQDVGQLSRTISSPLCLAAYSSHCCRDQLPSSEQAEPCHVPTGLCSRTSLIPRLGMLLEAQPSHTAVKNWENWALGSNSQTKGNGGPQTDVPCFIAGTDGSQTHFLGVPKDGAAISHSRGQLVNTSLTGHFSVPFPLSLLLWVRSLNNSFRLCFWRN